MGAEGGVRAHLQAEFDRLATANWFAALGLEATATPADIRAAFLALTKRYHPSRYARQERDVVRLANEVFLRVKDAYTALGDVRKREKLAAELAPAAPVAAASARAATVEPKRPSGRIPRPATARSMRSGAVRARTQGTRAQTQGTRAQTQSTRAQTQSTRAQTQGGRAKTQGGRARPQGRAPSVPADLVPQDSVRARNEEYETALRMLTRGQYKQARELLQKVAVQDPKTKKYRVQLHYAWGLEHEEAGAYDEARAELQRAINADPTFKRAHEALDKLPGKKGFFSKLFGR